MKILPVGVELFHADKHTDGQTDGHDEGNSRYPQYCEGASHTHIHTRTLNTCLFSCSQVYLNLLCG
jgi:hypothetical protein